MYNKKTDCMSFPSIFSSVIFLLFLLFLFCNNIKLNLTSS